MRKGKKAVGILSALLSALLLCGTLLFPASAARVSITPGRVTATNVYSYAEVPVYTESGARLSGRLIQETTYVPLRAFFAAYMKNASLTYSAKTRTATLTGDSLTLSATDGSNILYANGRCLYADMPIRILSDGTMYVPIRSLAKVLTLEVLWRNETRSVSLVGRAVPLVDGSVFYKEDEVYWLSRIISAEARGEPFIGQVAVGNVVLNRVRHSDFPNTIWGVIFDRKYGTQFSPVSYGTIYNNPSSDSIIAAKICLEGYSLSTEALFFMNPRISTSFWISENRPFLFTIGKHDFYA